ncbi:unnamed protein product [Strongylus vulgaris]|uniref:Uncharacterized protein n=1 Tax=Strongylus vulgaris TaxID=40348 RepID=A0A3P7IDQ4_STRVU|nr:unnamed protein product [Strongylus vulgaris]
MRKRSAVLSATIEPPEPVSCRGQRGTDAALQPTMYVQSVYACVCGSTHLASLTSEHAVVETTRFVRTHLAEQSGGRELLGTA